MPGMVSPGPTAIRPRGPSNTAVSSNTDRTDQLAVPFSSMRGISGFAMVGFGFWVAFALALDTGFWTVFATGLATGLRGGDGGGCTTGWVFTGVAAVAG